MSRSRLSTHDLVNQRADDPLACRRRGGRTTPRLLDISTQRKQSTTFRIGERRLRACGQHVSLLLERAHREQPRIPALLEIRSNKAVLWVDHVVLPMCTSRFEARLLEGQLNLPALLGIFGALLIQGIESSLDAEWLKSLRLLPCR